MHEAHFRLSKKGPINRVKGKQGVGDEGLRVGYRGAGGGEVEMKPLERGACRVLVTNNIAMS